LLGVVETSSSVIRFLGFWASPVECSQISSGLRGVSKRLAGAQGSRASNPSKRAQKSCI
jgi:hypothetical protein